jgi:hypothetical protein
VPTQIAVDLSETGIPVRFIGYEYQPLSEPVHHGEIGERGLVAIATSGPFGRIAVDVASGHVVQIPQTDSETASHVNRDLGAFNRCVAAVIARFPFDSAILYREQFPPYTAIVHEAALRTQFGACEVTRAQLEHLEASEQANIFLRVTPFNGTSLPTTGHAVDYFHGPVPTLDTVEVDTAHGSELADDAGQLEKIHPRPGPYGGSHLEGRRLPRPHPPHRPRHLGDEA